MVGQWMGQGAQDAAEIPRASSRKAMSEAEMADLQRRSFDEVRKPQPAYGRATNHDVAAKGMFPGRVTNSAISDKAGRNGLAVPAIEPRPPPNELFSFLSLCPRSDPRGNICVSREPTPPPHEAGLGGHCRGSKPAAPCRSPRRAVVRRGLAPEWADAKTQGRQSGS